MNVNPYLSFSGNCADAIKLYEEAFGAKAKIMKYGEAPKEEDYTVSEETKDLIMHAQLSFGDGTLMFADNPPGMPVSFGDAVSITISFADEEQAKSAFAVLKEGGKVHMDLRKTFWSACFGMLEDKFGINWMFTLEKKE